MLEIERATVARSGRRVLEDASLRLAPGRLVAVVGPNGSGKSTLLKAASGELRLAAGRIMLDGRDISGMAAGDLAARRAVVAQSTHLSFPFTVLGVVMLGLTVPGFGLASRIETAVDALADVDLAGFEGRTYTQLSGGERQRVHIARALCQLRASPAARDATRLFLLDEPTSSLDPGQAALVLDLLREEAEAGRCVIVVLHDLNLAGGWADEIVLLDQGRIIAQGRPAAVLQDGLLSQAYRCAIRVNAVPVEGYTFVLPHHLKRRAIARDAGKRRPTGLNAGE